MSEQAHQEARTVAFFPVFDAATGAKVSFTIRGGTTQKEAGEDLAVLRDVLASVGTFGLSLKLDVEGGDGEWDDVREGLHWVRGTSYKGKPCAFVYADNAAVQEKVVTLYKHVIPDCPITQEQWDAAPVWNDGGRSPKKDEAVTSGHLQTFPFEVRFGGKDQGDDKVFNGNRAYWWDAVLNPAPGGVTFDGKSAPSTVAASAPASAPAPVNTGGQCPECHAPAGKPHTRKCSLAGSTTNGASLPAAVTKGLPATTAKPASQRQIFAAQLKMLGEALYQDWETTRHELVTSAGVDSGSAGDLSDAQLSLLVDKLKDAAVEAMLNFAEEAGWTEETAQEKLNEFGYKKLAEWDGDAGSLPVTFVVKLFNAAIMEAADA